MNSHISQKPFIFNENIDIGFIQSMYDNDYPFIQDIYNNTNSELSVSIPILETAFEAGDIRSIQKVIHKIKPSFGFTGLLRIQEKLQLFEDACIQYDSTEALKSYYLEIKKEIDKGYLIIRNEYKILKEYNDSIV